MGSIRRLHARTGRSLLAILVVLAATLGQAAPALANWQGTWSTSGEEWRIVENDGRVFGEIGAGGFFEGRVSGDGRSMRAAFQFGDGRRGFTEMRLHGTDVFVGPLSLSAFPEPAANVWAGPLHYGERRSSAEPILRSARARGTNYPSSLGPAPNPAIIAWLDFGSETPDAGVLDPSSQDEVQPADARPVSMWEGRWDADGALILYKEGSRVFGTRSLIGSTGRIEARLSPSGRVLRGYEATSVVSPDPLIPSSITYFEVSMGGDNLSFSGKQGRTIEATKQNDAIWYGYKQGSDVPPPAPDAATVFMPSDWSGRPPAEVSAWLAFDDLPAPGTADQGYGIGEWRLTMSGSRIGPMGHGAIMRMSAPDADGMVYGNINAYAPGSAVVLGRMFSAGEFRGIWMTLDDTGLNPSGSWGTLRLAGHPSSRQFTGSWALAYRAPSLRRQAGMPGGRIEGRVDGNTVLEPLTGSVTSARANLRRLIRSSANIPALFRGVRPDAGIEAALAAWWTEGADICAAGCLAPEPKQIVITPDTLLYDAGTGFVGGERTARLYGSLRALVQFRTGADTYSRAAETPRWVDIWDAPQDYRVAVTGDRDSVFVVTPPEYAAREERAACPLTAGSPLEARRRAITIDVPEGLFSDPDREIIVNLEGEVWRHRDPRRDEKMGENRIELPLKGALASKFENSAAGTDPDDISCLQRSLLLGFASSRQQTAFRTVIDLVR